MDYRLCRWSGVLVLTWGWAMPIRAIRAKNRVRHLVPSPVCSWLADGLSALAPCARILPSPDDHAGRDRSHRLPLLPVIAEVAKEWVYRPPVRSLHRGRCLPRLPSPPSPRGRNAFSGMLELLWRRSLRPCWAIRIPSSFIACLLGAFIANLLGKPLDQDHPSAKPSGTYHRHTSQGWRLSLCQFSVGIFASHRGRYLCHRHSGNFRSLSPLRSHPSASCLRHLMVIVLQTDAAQITNMPFQSACPPASA